MDGPQGASVVEASSDFVMINVADDKEPKGKEFSPDGGFVFCLFSFLSFLFF